MAIPPTPAHTNQRRKRFKNRTTRAIAVLRERRVGLSWNGIIIGGLGAGVALWPLARAAWDLLGLTTGQTWRLVFLGACALVLAAGVVGANRKRTSPVRLVWLILAVWLVAAGAVAVLTALAWLVLGTPDWQQLEDLTPKQLDAIATRAFAIVAGLGGVALLVIAYRRQRTTEADAERAERASEREVTKLFNERFTAAYTELGSEHAAVRLGAVHALAHLADDAPSEEEVQMVIDVLCAYLRMPYTPRPDTPAEQPDQPILPSASPTAVDLGRLRSTDLDDAQREKQQAAQEEHRRRVLDFESFQQVRHTIIRIIGNHLREPTRWRGKNYDFTGVVFDGGDLSGTHFTGGTVTFGGARFSGGTVTFGGAWFSGGEVDFARAEFSGGTVSFAGAKFTGEAVDFGKAEFSGGEVDFSGAKFTGGEVSFFGAKFTGGEVEFGEAKFAGGEVSFFGAKFTGGEVSFFGAKFTGGEVDFVGAEFAGGEVSFAGAEFTGEVDFGGAKFTGGDVFFAGAEFTGEAVDFRRAKFTGGTVDFKDASGTYPSGFLEAVERSEPGAVLVPESWRVNADRDREQNAPDTSTEDGPTTGDL